MKFSPNRHSALPAQQLPPFKTSTRGHSERGPLVLTCLRSSELLTYPAGTQNKVLVPRRERIRQPNSTRELLPLSLSGMTVQRYGRVTTNADLQSSCFGEIVLARGKNRRDEIVSAR